MLKNSIFPMLKMFRQGSTVLSRLAFIIDVSSPMDVAFALAEEALDAGEVPVGCVLVVGELIIGRGRNAVNEWRNGTRHAEMVAFDQALRWCQSNGRWPDLQLSDAVLYVTSEPCMMCAAAIGQMKIGHLVYACGNERFGGFGSVVDVQRVFGYQYPLTIVKDVQRNKAIRLLQNFYEMENPNAPVTKCRRKLTRL